jgi:hypothetical protein
LDGEQFGSFSLSVISARQDRVERDGLEGNRASAVPWGANQADEREHCILMSACGTDDRRRLPLGSKFEQIVAE